MGILIIISSIILSGLVLLYFWRHVIRENRKVKAIKSKSANPQNENLNPNSNRNPIPHLTQVKILFDAGMSNLNQSAINQLNEIIELLQTLNGTELSRKVIHITGSADASGNLSRNKTLARERSLVVKKTIETKLKSSQLKE